MGVELVRLVGFDEPDFYAYHAYLKAHSLKTAVVLTGSSFSTDDYRGESADYAKRIQPDVWLLANEWDIQGAASWPTSDDGFVDFWNHAAPGIRVAQPLANLYIGGLFDAAAALDRLSRVWPRLTLKPNGIDFHPYMATVDAITLLLSTARVRFGCQIGVFEWNDSTPKNIASFEKLLEGLTEHSCFIPWSTEQLDGELPGLMKRDRYTAVGRAYRSAIKV